MGLENQEIRIVLNEKNFSDLCILGRINDLIIKQEDFDNLIDGQIIKIEKNSKKYKILLQDIGYDRIYKYLKLSKIYK
jgi:hypothetical protein